MGEYTSLGVWRRSHRQAWEGRILFDGKRKEFGLGRQSGRYEAEQRLVEVADRWVALQAHHHGAAWVHAMRSGPFEALIQHYISHKRDVEQVRGSTWKKYQQHLTKLAREVPVHCVDDLRLGSVRAWLTRITPDCAQKQLSHLCNTAKSFSEFLWDEGITECHLLERLKVPKGGRPRRSNAPLTDDEIVRLLTLSPANRSDFYAVCLCTGIRQEEAGRLVVADVVLDGEVPHIVLPEHGTKTYKRRKSVLWCDVARSAAATLVDGRQPSERLFSVPSHHTVRRDFDRAGIPAQRSDARPLGPGSFRKTAAQRGQGHVSRDRIREQLGHESETMTELYLDQELVATAAAYSTVPQLPISPTRMPTEGVVIGERRATESVRHDAAEFAATSSRSNSLQRGRTANNIREHSDQEMEPGGIEPPCRDGRNDASMRVVEELISTHWRPSTASAGSSLR